MQVKNYDNLFECGENHYGLVLLDYKDDIDSIFQPSVDSDTWIRNLKSGEYEQIEGRLKAESGYCCLGVLGEVLQNSNSDEFFYEDEPQPCWGTDKSYKFRHGVHSSSTVLPGELFSSHYQIARVSTEDLQQFHERRALNQVGEDWLYFDEDTLQSMLVDLNDTEHLTFVQIAEFLETVLEMYSSNRIFTRYLDDEYV